MTQALSLNQFEPNTPVDGMYAYQANLPQLHNIIVSNTQETPLSAGAFLTIDDTSTNKYAPVAKQAATTDSIFGVVSFTPLQSQFSGGERIGIARANDIIFKTAAAAIPAGSLVTFNEQNQVLSATSGNVVVGRAITPATAANELIQVELQFHTPSTATN